MASSYIIQAGRVLGCVHADDRLLPRIKMSSFHTSINFFLQKEKNPANIIRYVIRFLEIKFNNDPNWKWINSSNKLSINLTEQKKKEKGRNLCVAFQFASKQIKATIKRPVPSGRGRGCKRENPQTRVPATTTTTTEARSDRNFNPIRLHFHPT